MVLQYRLPVSARYYYSVIKRFSPLLAGVYLIQPNAGFGFINGTTFFRTGQYCMGKKWLVKFNHTKIFVIVVTALRKLPAGVSRVFIVVYTVKISPPLSALLRWHIVHST